MITSFHLLAIAFTLFLFTLVYYLYGTTRKRTAIVTHQVLRLSYLLVIITGILLLPLMPVTVGRLLKLMAGLLTVGFMEIFLMHRMKEDLGRMHWIIFAILLGSTIILGLMLPLGIGG